MPAGHGYLYQTMLGSGTLDKLLEKGFSFMFVPTSDNLGATMAQVAHLLRLAKDSMESIVSSVY